RRPCDRHGLEALEDAVLQVLEEPEGGVGDAGGDRDEQDAGQQVGHVPIRPLADRAAEHIDEQQQEGDRHDRGRDDGVGAAGDVAQGPPRQQGGVTEKARAHGWSFLVGAEAVSVPASPSVPVAPTMARKTSSRVGCFSTYSTLAGGRSCLSSARVPLAMIRPSSRIAIRSASCSASSRDWVVSSTVVPCPASSLTLSHTSMRACGSSPVVGSSRKITGGFPMRLMAMSRRRRMPPEYVATLRLAASVSWKRASRSSATWPASGTRR